MQQVYNFFKQVSNFFKNNYTIFLKIINIGNLAAATLKMSNFLALEKGRTSMAKTTFLYVNKYTNSI